MLFNSLQFLIFFPAVVILYFLLPHKFRLALLLASSYYFYMSWKAEYAILILISTAASFFSGIYIERSKSKAQRRLFLGVSILVNLGILVAFKYLTFFSNSARQVFQLFSIQFDPLM